MLIGHTFLVYDRREYNSYMRRLVVIEGLDGSGKATQTKLLTEYLQESVCARKVSFPDYASDSSALIKMYLSGQFGDKPGDVNAFAASAFYAVDRFASFKKDWGKAYQDGTIIVADRYTTSNAIHQCSKLPREQWDEYIQWLLHFEYDLLGIPTPDAVIYLKVDPEISQRLMTGRYHGDESKKDIHEKDMEYLKRSREAAEYCCERLGWKEVQCTNAEGMRSIEDIQNEIRGIVENL